MDLAKMQVTSASKKAESMFGVAAAISVVTAEEIRRSGATNIPEALRLVPGVQVAQVNASQYAVTIRGFNSLYSAKMLVLIDGRSIYNNFWGGVYWEDQAISMDEIDRIEVIRGPGGTLWGANAVNGVINIITKLAKDTAGVLVRSEGATNGTVANGTLRYGSALARGDFRVTVQGVRDAQSLSVSNTDNNDQRSGDKFSFRYDGGSDTTGKILVEGDLHRFDLNLQAYEPTSGFPFQALIPSTVSDLGGSILAKIERTLSDGSSNSFQASYDHNYKYIDPNLLDRDGTVDLQFQHSFQPLRNHSLIAGAGFRTTTDDYSGSLPTLNPVSETTRVFSFFGQDQLSLNSSSKLTVGTKMEHNDFSGWEIEPSARLAVESDATHTWWCSLSRAVETPNRANHDLNLPYEFVPIPIGGGQYLPGNVTLKGNSNLKSTAMVAAETGYRFELGRRMTADLSLFQNSYTHMNGSAKGTLIMGNPIVIPINYVDTGSSTVRGFEISTKLHPIDKLRFDLGYSYEVTDAEAGTFAAPKHEVKELGTYDFSDRLKFDQAIYYSGASSDGTPSYTRFDFQLRYKAGKNCDFSLGARNLGCGNYAQIASSSSASGQLVRPALYSQVAIKF